MSKNRRHLYIVSGSRELSDEESQWVSEKIAEFIGKSLEGISEPEQTVWMHGACSTGVDKLCAQLFPRALAMPAPWSSLGRSAGPSRNGAMVEVARAMHHCGWTVYLFAFPRDGGRGTQDMMRQFDRVRQTHQLNRGRWTTMLGKLDVKVEAEHG